MWSKHKHQFLTLYLCCFFIYYSIAFEADDEHYDITILTQLFLMYNIVVWIPLDKDKYPQITATFYIKCKAICINLMFNLRLM